MPLGITARLCAPGFATTTSKSELRAKACVFCPSFCLPRVLGSILLNPSGSMGSGLSSSQMACSRPRNWLSGSVPTITVPMKLIYLSRKRSLENALESQPAILVPCVDPTPQVADPGAAPSEHRDQYPPVQSHPAPALHQYQKQPLE